MSISIPQHCWPSLPMCRMGLQLKPSRLRTPNVTMEFVLCMCDENLTTTAVVWQQRGRRSTQAQSLLGRVHVRASTRRASTTTAAASGAGTSRQDARRNADCHQARDEHCRYDGLAHRAYPSRGAVAQARGLWASSRDTVHSDRKHRRAQAQGHAGATLPGGSGRWNSRDLGSRASTRCQQDDPAAPQGGVRRSRHDEHRDADEQPALRAGRSTSRLSSARHLSLSASVVDRSRRMLHSL